MTAIEIFDEMARCKNEEELRNFCVFTVRPFVQKEPEYRLWLLDRYASVKWLIGLPVFKVEDVLNGSGLRAWRKGEISYDQGR